MRKVKQFLFKFLNNTCFKEFQPLLLVIILCVVMIILKGDFSWIDLIDYKVGLSLLIPALFGVLIVVLVQILSKSLEDINKINCNYYEIIDFYKEEVCLKVNIDQRVFKIPYVSVYTNTEKKNIQISHSNDEFVLPLFFETHYKDLISFHKHSKIENNYAIRLNKIEETVDALKIHTCITTYFKSLITNRTMDGELKKYLTVRNVFEFGPKLNLLENSKLSNHLGLSVLMITSDGYFVLSRRTRNTSISKNKISSSVSASLKFKYAIINDDFTVNGLIKGVKREIKNETGLCLKQYNIDFTISENFLGLARDLTEGGKPNFFFALKVPLTKLEFIQQFRMKHKNPSRKNKSGLSQAPNNPTIDEYREVKSLLFLKADDIKPFGLYYLKVKCSKFKLLKKKYELSHEFMTSLYYYYNVYKNRENM